ncbi:pentatricopeptide repeat domain-containing protein [Allomyces macrogynus ATCC 38327]|uniref:Pentatricopeptide repeat domain-containing protein n=1 Tax=Allomyces macrogynus (strain ATCC 38327) TaxID=578462 RepID=A0A0L0SXC6_ALLM3|nr:pentatricopeptide repeat domain-containing protein [Allomyces macrogynus ATCC 38327]|eukprot:KNE67141.1 pentatricopeptide repeat domain-containing protein [Allomyces macrogynus ATCC 38327]
MWRLPRLVAQYLAPRTRSAPRWFSTDGAAAPLAPFPTSYLSNVTILDTRDLNKVDDATVVKVTTEATQAINEWVQHEHARSTTKSSDDSGTSNVPSAHERRLSPLNSLVALHRAMVVNARRGNTDVVEQLYQLAQTAKLPLEPPIHNDRLWALAQADIQAALVFFNDLKRRKLANDYSLTILVDHLVKAQQPYRALDLVDEWEASGRAIPQPTFTSLIAGFHRLRAGDMAWKLFHRMQLKYALPDEVTYSLMMAVCAQSGDVEKALSLFDTMRASHLAPTTVTINSLLHAMSKRRDYAPQALDFYLQCLTAEFRPDARTFGSLMACARRAQAWTTLGRAVWAEAARWDMQSEYLRAQALWTVSVEQVRARRSLRDQVDALVPRAEIDRLLDELASSARPLDEAPPSPDTPLDLLNAYLATCFPHHGNDGMAVFDRMPRRNGMTFRLALSYCMEDPLPDASAAPSVDDTPPTELDAPDRAHTPTMWTAAAVAKRHRGVAVWAAWEAWYRDLRKACARYVQERQRADPTMRGSSAHEAFMARYTMTRPVLYKLIVTGMNGVAVEYPRKAVALLLHCAREYGVRIVPRDFDRVAYMVRTSGDEQLARQWEVVVETYAVKESALEKSLMRLRRKWTQVRK